MDIAPHIKMQTVERQSAVGSDSPSSLSDSVLTGCSQIRAEEEQEVAVKTVNKLDMISQSATAGKSLVLRLIRQASDETTATTDNQC